MRDLIELFKILERILCCSKRQQHSGKGHIIFNVETSHFTCYGVSKMLIQAGQILQINIKPVDRFGNPAKIDGAPTWVLSDTTIASVEVDETGLKAKVPSAGPMGSTTLTVSADADIGEGVKTLSGELVIDVEAGEAVDLGLLVEPPVVIDLTPDEPPVEPPVEPVV